MPTDAKRQAVAELAEMLRSSSAIAVADYRGLKVAEMQSVRRTLRDSGVQLHVAKNRLGLPEEMPLDWEAYAHHLTNGTADPAPAGKSKGAH